MNTKSKTQIEFILFYSVQNPVHPVYFFSFSVSLCVLCGSIPFCNREAHPVVGRFYFVRGEGRFQFVVH